MRRSDGAPPSAQHDANRAGVVFRHEGLQIVADARLYGREELAKALGLRGSRDIGDPELIARGYQRWGNALPEHLDGDFAFVILDGARGGALVATDPMGVCPLFHRHARGQSFSFASRAPELARHLGMDARMLESRLLYPFVLIEELWHLHSRIVGIDRLLAGHACWVDAQGVKAWRYWRPEGNRPDLPRSDARRWIEETRSRLECAVRKRTEAGASMGVMLSGGLDSSSLLALAARCNPSVRAYSLRDGTRGECPETRAIDRMLEATGVEHFCLDVATLSDRSEADLALLAQMPRFDYIFNGFMPILHARAVQDGVVEIMNGLDADSLFHEGDFNLRRMREGRYGEVARDARKLDRGLGIPFMVPELRRTYLSALLPESAKRAYRRLARGARQSGALRAALIRPEAVQRLRLHEAMSERARLCLSERTLASPELPATYMHVPTVLDGVERIEERASLFGIRLCTPFLDRELIEFAAWIPLEFRFRNGRLKWIFRRAMNPYLPHDVAWRGDKLHLGSHFHRVLLRPVLDRTVRAFSDPRSGGPAIAPYVDRARFLEEAERWRGGEISGVWALAYWLALEHWLQHNADEIAWGL